MNTFGAQPKTFGAQQNRSYRIVLSMGHSLCHIVSMMDEA